MLTPEQIHAATLEQLRDARTEMSSFEWKSSIEDADDATKQKSAQTLLSVQQTILALENQNLADIRDKLVANETALSDGIAKVKDALDDITDIATALKAIGALIEIVGKVASLVA